MRLRTPWGDLGLDEQQLSMAEQYEYLRGGISRRRFLQGALAAGAASVIGPTLWRQSVDAVTVPALSPHLSYGADARTQMVVSWSSPVSVRRPILRYRPLGARAWSSALPAETRTVPGVESAYHHVRLSRLTPGSTFEYIVGEPGRNGPQGRFATAPSRPRGFRFTAFGDQGVSDNAVLVTAAVASQRPDFHFHVGDLCYAYQLGLGSSQAIPDDFQGDQFVHPEVWDEWLGQIKRVASNVPWMVTVGNHEMEPGYGKRGYEQSVVSRFVLPGNGARVKDEPVVTYSFDYGNARFIALDANEANYEIPANVGYLGGAQERWLEAKLKEARQSSRIDWIVVGYHQCSYCTNLLHASDQGLRDKWDGLFERYQVDLVINGHNHSYERAHPKLAAAAGPLDTVQPTQIDPTRDGTTYITAGSGGNPRIELSAHPMSYVTIEGGGRVPEPAPWSVTRYLDLSYIAVDVTPRVNGTTMMTVKALTPYGTKVDAVRLRRSRRR
ncbi:MAG: purple acid phosphatase family protein [Actinomycetota bacterium]